MSLMVQDLTNPMLAQIPHGLLLRTLDNYGLRNECDAVYPEASRAEAKVHPACTAGAKAKSISRAWDDLALVSGGRN